MTAASKALFMAARARVFAFGYVNRLNWKNKAASPPSCTVHPHPAVAAGDGDGMRNAGIREGWVACFT